MLYAPAYVFGINDKAVREDLLAMGDVINAFGLEVVERKFKNPRITYKLGKGLYVVLKCKVKFSDGNVMKFKFDYPLGRQFKLVTLDQPEQGEGVGEEEVAELQKQLEALGLGGAKSKEAKAKNTIGFVTE